MSKYTAMTAKDNKISLLNAISIGIGGMVGGGIFAVLGLAVELAQGGTPLAFIFAGIIALATAYSYSKLSHQYPGRGGTVDFLDGGFHSRIIAGGFNNTLWISYVVMIALYASAFGSYGAAVWKPFSSDTVNAALFQSAIIIVSLLLNYFSIALVSRIESIAVVIKLAILLGFVALGFYGFSHNSDHLAQLTLSHWPKVFSLLTGGMVIFVAYEGFELIANSVADLRNPEKNIARAYFGSVGLVVLLYFLIAVVTVGSLPFAKIAAA